MQQSLRTITSTTSTASTSTVDPTLRTTSPLTVPMGRRLLATAAVAGVALAMSACGAITEKITEEGAERIIEAETGGDVELDLDGDGGFSVQSDEGGFSLNEDGEFVITDGDGSVFSGSADDDSLVVFDDDGDPVLDFDGDGSNGQITMQGEDGEAVFRVVEDIPEEWPSDVPRPEGLAVDGGTYVAAEGEVQMTIVGTPDGSAIDYTNTYVASLTSSGFTETGRFDSTQDGVTAQRSLENVQWFVNINGYTDDSTNIVNLSIVTKN